MQKLPERTTTMTPRRFVKPAAAVATFAAVILAGDRKSTRLNSSHLVISYAVFCLKKTTLRAPHVLGARARPRHSHRRRPRGAVGGAVAFLVGAAPRAEQLGLAALPQADPPTNPEY